MAFVPTTSNILILHILHTMPDIFKLLQLAVEKRLLLAINNPLASPFGVSPHWDSYLRQLPQQPILLY